MSKETDRIIVKLKAAAKKRTPEERAANVKRLQAVINRIDRQLARASNDG